MSWTNAVVTEDGLALQAKLVDGQTLGFLRVAAGTGTVDPSALANQTALVNEKQTLTFQPPDVLDGAKIKVPVMLNNIGLETGYTMQQLGFFADDPDDGEILYAIVQDEVGDTVPSQTESPGFVIEWAFVFQYGNADSVAVTLDPVGLVGIGMVGAPNGVASLGPDGKLPKEQLCQHTHSAADITSGTLAVARGGTGASDAQGARTNLDVARPVRAEVAFPATGWAVAGGAYQQTVSCADAAEAMRYANIGPKYSADAAARELEQQAYACIAYVDTADGQLIATCWDGESKPEVNLTLIFEGGAA